LILPPCKAYTFQRLVDLKEVVCQDHFDEIGNNTVKPGANTVIVKVGSTVIFNKTYRMA